MDKKGVLLCLVMIASTIGAQEFKSQKVTSSLEQEQSAKITSIKKEIPHLNKANFDSYVASSSELVVDVYAPWCPPCKRLAPILEELYNDASLEYTFAKLDGDKEIEIAKSLNIHSFPTLIFYKEGKEVGRHSGYLSQQQLVNKLNLVFHKT